MHRQFHSQFHLQRHSLLITLKYTTLVCMRSSNGEPGNRDNGASDVWALTAYLPKLYIGFQVGASGRVTTINIDINAA